MIKKIINKFKKNIKYKKFLKMNKNSQIRLKEYNDCENIIVGNYSYGTISLIDFHDGTKLRIGNFDSIANDTFFCLGGEHDLKKLSTFPFDSKLIDKKITSHSKGDIIIKDDVWIGTKSTILSGVTIGQGAVIAAGSIVVDDVPPYSIVGGVPAKVIRYRFEEDIISRLMSIDYSKITKEFVIANKELFNQEITRDNIDEIVKKLT